MVIFYVTFVLEVILTLLIQTGLFLVFYDRRGDCAPLRALRNSENLKSLTTKLAGWIDVSFDVRIMR